MTTELLGFVAALGLPGDRPTPPPVTEGTVGAVLEAAAEERLMGLLDQAAAAGAIEVDDRARERIGEEAVRTQAWCLLVERHHLVVHRVLADAGVDVRFLKGPAAAHRFYPHPALRTFVDVDLLVPGDQLDAAVGALVASGHARSQAALTPKYASHYGKSVTLRSPDGIEVDVHRVFASGPYGLARPAAALWERPAARVSLGGTTLPALDPAAALVHAGVHAVTGRRMRLGSLREVAQLAEAIAGARQLADALRVTAPVARAAQLAIAQLAVADSEPLSRLSRWPVSARDERWLATYGAGGSWRGGALAGAAAIPGIRDKSRYGAEMVRAARSRRGANRPME